MVKARHLSPQSVWDPEALLAAFREAGIKEAHAARLWGLLLQEPGLAWEDVPNLPKAAMAVLNAKFTRSTSKLLSVSKSAGGDTIKLLVELQDGMQVEAVVMQYDARRTLCVSSQVGCQMGCTFCATGTMGLLGNLSAGEILEQLVHARQVTPIRNVVFMGMGEPLNNYPAVRSAVQMMCDNRVFAMGKRHVTVSTVGVVPRMLQMAEDMPGCRLALSLHAPTQELRQQIVPSARAYPLPKLMAAMDNYQAASKQKVFVEYVVLADVNDGVQQAHELGALLQHRDVIINLIPWNPIYNPKGPALEAPDASRVVEFQRVLIDTYSLHCTVRQEKGQDIAGACGQLVIDYNKGQQGCGKSSSGAVTDIEDLGRGRVAVAGS